MCSLVTNISILRSSISIFHVYLNFATEFFFVLVYILISGCCFLYVGLFQFYFPVNLFFGLGPNFSLLCVGFFQLVFLVM